MTAHKKIGIRWTVGDVSAEGFQALQFSAWGASRMFRDEADYAICVNSVPVDYAKDQTGEVPQQVCWRSITASDVPALFHRRLDQDMAEGVAWKFAPLRIFPDRHELSLDNDCIVWAIPNVIRHWLRASEFCLMAADVCRCFGQFAHLCGPEPRNSGIRGLPPDFNLEAALWEVLSKTPATLRSELDEQGLQAAALSRKNELLAVPVHDVTVCSPFPPHLPFVGSCGAHFVGLNARDLGWSIDGIAASQLTRELWKRLRPEICRRVGYQRLRNPNLTRLAQVREPGGDPNAKEASRI